MRGELVEERKGESRDLHGWLGGDKETAGE